MSPALDVITPHTHIIIALPILLPCEDFGIRIFILPFSSGSGIFPLQELEFSGIWIDGMDPDSKEWIPEWKFHKGRMPMPIPKD